MGFFWVFSKFFLNQNQIFCKMEKKKHVCLAAFLLESILPINSLALFLLPELVVKTVSFLRIFQGWVLGPISLLTSFFLSNPRSLHWEGKYMCWPSFAKHLRILQFKPDLSCAERPSRQSWRSKHIQRSCAPIWAWWCLERSDQIIGNFTSCSVCHGFWCCFQISGGVDLEEIGHWWFGSLWLFGPTSTRDYDVTWAVRRSPQDPGSTSTFDEEFDIHHICICVATRSQNVHLILVFLWFSAVFQINGSEASTGDVELSEPLEWCYLAKSWVASYPGHEKTEPYRTWKWCQMPILISVMLVRDLVMLPNLSSGKILKSPNL